MRLIYRLLDRYILPIPVQLLTNRITIVLTMALLLPLVLFADHTALVLVINSYLNVMSVTVSSIVLLWTTAAEEQERKQQSAADEAVQHHLREVLEPLHAQQTQLGAIRPMPARSRRLAAMTTRTTTHRNARRQPSSHAACSRRQTPLS
jgi:hypothetical protein